MANRFKKALDNRSVNMEQSEVTLNEEVYETLDNSEDTNVTEENNSDVIEESNEEASDTSSVADLLADLGSPKKKEFKNKTYYLSVDLTKEISKVAKAKKMSESKLLNDLLEKIFMNK